MVRSRREEYTKRFEELTKQEIKNYNDSLLQTHVALEEFRRKLKDSVDVYAQQVAHLSSLIKKVECENVDLKNEVANLSKKLQSQIHDFNKLEREKIEGDKKIDTFQKWVIKECADLNNSQYRVDEAIRDSTFMMKRQVEDVFQEVGHCYRKTKEDNEKLKQEILSIPSEAEKVKKELLKKASESAIDNAGFIKELNVIKKKSTIQESLNQYFHTQLERIKNTQVTKE